MYSLGWEWRSKYLLNTSAITDAICSGVLIFKIRLDISLDSISNSSEGAPPSNKQYKSNSSMTLLTIRNVHLSPGPYLKSEQ